MRKGMLRMATLAASFAALWVVACDGRGAPQTLEGRLLDYIEHDLVTFSVSGEARCGHCTGDEGFVGMHVEIYLKGDPARDLAVQVFDGPGPFYIKDVRTLAGVTGVVRARLFSDPLDPYPLSAKAEFETPQRDWETVSVELSF